MSARPWAVGLLALMGCSGQRATSREPVAPAASPGVESAMAAEGTTGRADEQACALNVARACNDWGVALLDGVGVAKDVARAAQVLEHACKLGSAWGCYNFGFVLETGVTDAPRVRDAFELYDTACVAGVPDACNRLGLLSSEPANEAEVKQDHDRALAAFLKACDAKLAVACGNAGWLLGRIRPGEAERISELLRRGCDGDAGVACAMLAERLAAGLGQAADVPRAVQCFEKACKLEPAVGCYFWGVALLDPESGLETDAQKGRGLLARACELHHPPACATLEELATQK